MTVLQDAATDELHKAMLHQAELYLDGQLRLTIATQARATTLASIFLPASTALLGAAVAFGNAAPIQWAGLIAAAALLAGALACLHAAVKPTELGVPGSEPRMAYENMEAFHRAESQYYQARIDNNDHVIKQYVRRLRIGARAGASAPFLGAITWFLWGWLESALASLRC